MTRTHSPAVYRRRRLVVFGGLLVVLAGIGVGVWLLLAQPWQASAAGPERTPAAEVETDDPSDAAEPDDADTDADAGEADAASDSEGKTPAPEPTVGPCVEDNIQVRPLTDATSYRGGAKPQLSIELTNTGDVDCTINVGSSTQVFTIRSGKDVWWRSTDCQKNPSDMIVTLEAGQTVTSAEPVEWNRTRSSVKICDSGNRPTARGVGRPIT
ncbi:hypothetical protein [Microbacterium sp. NIBRBAC000506063]|uniref:hypothetical protein n=1 Tax=Microbacterium sp. NIBRBAC000506063 TaxID=2734618 RepID=UPI001CB6D5DE|nr:hypothetical protein [Microbacterium sp. NIBRBAC000506063]